MKLSRILLVVLLFISVLNGCINQKHTGPLTYFRNFTVEFEEPPLLNKPVKLMCTITQWDFDTEAFLESDIFIEIELPEGFELVSGTLKWQGHVDPNQTITHTVTIKAVKTGKWTIRVWGGPSGSPRFELYNLYVIVTETSAEVFTDPYFGQTEFTEEEIRALTEGKSTSDIDDRARIDYEEEPGEEPQAAWIWVTGTVKASYGSEEIRIPYAKVELYDDDSGMEVLLATSCTDSNGYFSFYVENNDGPSQGGLDIFVKVHCTYWRSGETDKCVYVCPNFLGIAYSARNPATGCIPNVGGDVYFGNILVADSRPWYVYHYSYEEYKFFKNLGWMQPKIKVLWPESSLNDSLKMYSL